MRSEHINPYNMESQNYLMYSGGKSNTYITEQRNQQCIQVSCFCLWLVFNVAISWISPVVTTNQQHLFMLYIWFKAEIIVVIFIIFTFTLLIAVSVSFYFFLWYIMRSWKLKRPQIQLRPHHFWTYTSNLTTVVNSVLKFMIYGTTSILKS
jgi:hypothetical protein